MADDGTNGSIQSATVSTTGYMLTILYHPAP
jgi:hypothetical protein